LASQSKRNIVIFIVCYFAMYLLPLGLYLILH